MFSSPTLSTIVPAGITKPFDCNAVVIDCSVRPAAFIFAVFKVRLMRFLKTPSTETSRTPSIELKIGVATSAMILLSASLLPVFDDTPSEMTGMLSSEPERSLGVTPDGKPLRPARALERRSFTCAVVVP